MLADDVLHPEYWTTSLTDASTFGKLWSIFEQLVCHLHEVWLEHDSVQDCLEGLDELLSCLRCFGQNDSMVKLKVAVTCREAEYLGKMVEHIIYVTPEDLHPVLRDHIQTV